MSSCADPSIQPQGDLALLTLAMPSDTNPQGDVFGGWLMSQMDIAGAIYANTVVKGRVTTVAVSQMQFIHPVPVGSIVSCYCATEHIGTTSIRVGIQVWIKAFLTQTQTLVAEGQYVYVALDEEGHKRAIRF